jgi:hypothetical protein
MFINLRIVRCEMPTLDMACCWRSRRGEDALRARSQLAFILDHGRGFKVGDKMPDIRFAFAFILTTLFFNMLTALADENPCLTAFLFNNLTALGFH